MLYSNINNKTPIDSLANQLLNRGGHVSQYYLKENNKNKPAVVFLKRWFRGKNIHEALMRALS